MAEENNQKPAPKVNPRINALKNVMNADSVQEQFKNALKENSGTFIASVIDLYNSDSGLQECDPVKVVNEALKAAVLKLPINKALGFAYIIKFNNSHFDQEVGKWIKIPTPTFVPGYKGYIQLAMRTGYYRSINADVVYEGELQKTNKLTGEIKLDGEKTSDKIVGYFAHFELLNGFSKTLYVSVQNMAKHAKQYSPSIKNDNKVLLDTLIQLSGKDSTGLGWTGDFDSMALKTVLRNLLSKYGYLSVEMQTAITNDYESESTTPAITQATVIDIDAEDITPSSGEEKKEEQKPPYMQ
ncbi:MAG: recombinase RecT [Dysgonomonas sp.]